MLHDCMAQARQRHKATTRRTDRGRRRRSPVSHSRSYSMSAKKMSLGARQTSNKRRAAVCKLSCLDAAMLFVVFLVAPTFVCGLQRLVRSQIEESGNSLVASSDGLEYSKAAVSATNSKSTLIMPMSSSHLPHVHHRTIKGHLQKDRRFQNAYQHNKRTKKRQQLLATNTPHYTFHKSLLSNQNEVPSLFYSNFSDSDNKYIVTESYIVEATQQNLLSSRDNTIHKQQRQTTNLQQASATELNKIIQDTNSYTLFPSASEFASDNRWTFDRNQHSSNNNNDEIVYKPDDGQTHSNTHLEKLFLASDTTNQKPNLRRAHPSHNTKPIHRRIDRTSPDNNNKSFQVSYAVVLLN